MAEKISAAYKITNTVTGDFYIGSSKNVKERWRNHKKPSTLNKYPNNSMYLDFQKYGIDKFVFEILAEVEIDRLKEVEQEFIEKMHPTYNDRNANGWNIERKKEYEKSDKRKEYMKEHNNKYYNQLCRYNGEALTLRALSLRFYRAGVEHPVIEAKKYLVLPLKTNERRTVKR